MHGSAILKKIINLNTILFWQILNLVKFHFFQLILLIIFQFRKLYYNNKKTIIKRSRWNTRQLELCIGEIQVEIWISSFYCLECLVSTFLKYNKILEKIWRSVHLFSKKRRQNRNRSFHASFDSLLYKAI
jgi:hypothetical protein